jgi:hypothetical protein
LPADFYYRSDIRRLMFHTGGVAGDFGYCGVGRFDYIACVSGGDYSPQIASLTSGLVEQSVEQFFGKADDLNALVPQTRGQHAPVSVQQHNLDRSRSGVYSRVYLQSQLSFLLFYDLD